MSNELFLQIMGGIITILCALITGFVIPWLKSKVDAEQTAKLSYYVDMAVRCAEQIYTPEQWEQKKEYVTNYITDLINTTFKIKLSAEDINVLIEGAVNQIKRG